VFSRNGEKIVIVTHHAPSPQSIPPSFQESAFNPSFASDMTRFITESKAKLWIHGHIHSHSDYTVGGTRILANPRGYPGESKTGFDPGLVVEV
jgi:Icc-related predicted phosphoesterase